MLSKNEQNTVLLTNNKRSDDSQKMNRISNEGGLWKWPLILSILTSLVNEMPKFKTINYIRASGEPLSARQAGCIGHQWNWAKPSGHLLGNIL